MIKLFYIITYSYSKQGRDFGRQTMLTVYGIFAITIFCNLLTADILLEYLSDGEFDSLIPSIEMVLVLITILFYFLFLHKGRTQAIVEHYKQFPQLHTKKAKYLAYCMVLFLIILPFVTAVVLQRIKTGRWIEIS